ncbi:hypothetical protein hairong_144 [Pseudomonas phage hairong]|nr:hypothetical protein hairong_144 [Pseudomonas phage hairong]
MKLTKHAEFTTYTKNCEELQDGRFFCINGALVEYVSCDDNDFLVVYEAKDVCGPEHQDSIADCYTAESCAGVLMFTDDNYAAANATFAQLFTIAMKDGLSGVKRFLGEQA